MTEPERGRSRPQQRLHIGGQRIGQAFFTFHLAAPEDGRAPLCSPCHALGSDRTFVNA